MTAPMDIEGPAAPPRANGELVFAEPWESRAFAMAVALCEAGMFTWPQFQAALIARIASWATTSTARTGILPSMAGCARRRARRPVRLRADDVTARARAAGAAARPVTITRRR